MENMLIHTENPMKKKHTWFYLIFITVPAVFLLCLIVSDQVFRTRNINYSEWLTLIVGFLSYYGTIILAYVTVSQNAIISELTQKQLELQEKDLSSGNRPWFSISTFRVFKQLGKSFPYIQCCSFDAKDSLGAINGDFDIISTYRFKAPKSEFNFYDNTDNPGQIRFSISIVNRSKYNIIDLSYNSYKNDHRGNDSSIHQITPCTCKVHCLEPGLSLNMNGFQYLENELCISFKYYILIHYYNEFGKEFNDKISILVYEDPSKDDVVVFDLYHDGNTIDIDYSSPDDSSLIINGFK